MKKLIAYIPATAITLLIPLLSLVNPDKLPDTPGWNFPGLDKVVHFLMYGALTAAWAFALSSAIKANFRRMLTLALLSSFYGVVMEICQFYFTETRSMDILDAAANLAGALIAAIAYYLVYRIFLLPEEKS